MQPPPIDTLEPLRRHVHKTLKWSALAVLGAILFCLLLLAGLPLAAVWGTGKYLTQNSAVIIAVALLSLGLAIFYTVLTMKAIFRWRADVEPAYREQFRRHFLAPSLAEALPGFVANTDGAFDPTQFDASRLFRPSTSLISTAGFSSGPLRGAVLQTRHVSGESDTPIFTGILIHIARPIALRAPVRLVDTHVYTGHDREKWGVTRCGQTVQSATGIPAFDAVATVILDQDHPTLPPLPARLYQTWLEVRAHLNQPIFLSCLPDGLWLAVATERRRIPLEPQFASPNDPAELQAELRLLQSAIRAASALDQALA